MPRSAIYEREHRRGLVLGLTLAEVLLLLLFLLLLALAARLNQLQQEKQAVIMERDRATAALATFQPLVIGSIDKESQSAFIERIKSLAERERKVTDLEVANSKLTPITTALKGDASKFEATAAVIEWAARIDPDDPPAVLKRALVILQALGPATRPEDVTALTTMRRDLEVKIKLASEAAAGKHNWPPIISLSEADGHFFETGSAELSPELRTTLSGSVVTRLLATVKEYDVNIIEVIGHTDEQRIVERPSNLDKTLIPFLQKGPTERFIPADNAGLGLARAVAVVRVLSNDHRLGDLRILPLSGGQLIDVGDKRADGVSAGDVKERRRIEIRVRRAEKERNLTKAARSSETHVASLDYPIVGHASVIDGDTVDIGPTRVRIWGIDTIESGQTCSRDGRAWDCAKDISFGLSAHLEGQVVTCQPKGKDHHGRVLASCVVRGGDLGAWLVQQGLALDYTEFSGGAYKVEEAMARGAKRGIWRGEFMLPWEWRKQRAPR